LRAIKCKYMARIKPGVLGVGPQFLELMIASTHWVLGHSRDKATLTGVAGSMLPPQ